MTQVFVYKFSAHITYTQLQEVERKFDFNSIKRIRVNHDEYFAYICQVDIIEQQILDKFFAKFDQKYLGSKTIEI